ncbi:MAG: amidohydrolase family protein [Actinomycetota bacterium]|nr:amidohydrolase family protein [Actinomycetota bacterium]
MERIEADLLIPGRGQPVPDGAVVFDGGVISYAGRSTQAPLTPQATVIRAPVVMPGMWDCHGHFLGVRSLDLSRLAVEPIAVRAARCAGDLRAALDAGITSVREPGGLGVDLQRVVDEGLLDGPSIYGAGAILSTTGGHGDVHGLPLQAVHEFSQRGGELRLCDGVDECIRATREQLRRNAKLIKVCASGGVISEVDHPIHQQFTVAELRAIVEVAAMAERAVAAHCHGKPGIMAAIEAGVCTIEHGTYLDAEACDAMRETETILVTTRTVISQLANVDILPPYARRKMAEIREQHAKAIALAHEHGVTLAMGTDVALSGVEIPNSWGRNGCELPLLVEVGLSPLEAIEAATANAPLTLGAQAPRSGLLAEGHEADVLTLDADPLADIHVLAEPDHIVGVWKAGRRVKPTR